MTWVFPECIIASVINSRQYWQPNFLVEWRRQIEFLYAQMIVEILLEFSSNRFSSWSLHGPDVVLHW